MEATARANFDLANDIQEVSFCSSIRSLLPRKLTLHLPRFCTAPARCGYRAHVAITSTSLLLLGLFVLQVDQLFRYDKAAQQAIAAARPWRADPHHFKKVRISAVALLKMVSHVLCSMGQSAEAAAGRAAQGVGQASRSTKEARGYKRWLWAILHGSLLQGSVFEGKA